MKTRIVVTSHTIAETQFLAGFSAAARDAEDIVTSAPYRGDGLSEMQNDATDLAEAVMANQRYTRAFREGYAAGMLTAF